MRGSDCHAASDLWSIGIIAWFLFTGKPLFSSDTPDVDVVAMLLGSKQLPFEREPHLWMQFDKAQVQNLPTAFQTSDPNAMLQMRQVHEALLNV